ncbi:hypothetical protein B382_23848 [Stutzerimonas stutzeri B1SMN1]|nr:hypothetical protein B382_23848 [Stutzerimonas stutzeri B1SMN1]
MGLPKYFTGKPCANGHITYKLTSNYKCQQCSLDWINNKLRSDEKFAAQEREKCRIRNSERYKADKQFKAARDAYSAAWSRKQRASNESFRIYHNKRTSAFKRANPELGAARMRHRRKHDPDFQCQMLCRDLLKRAINLGFRKNQSSYDHLGYHPADLRTHIESLFSEGMSWQNRSEWHVDHIRPVSSFKGEDINPRVINALSNLMPVWKEQNLRKGSAWASKE